MGKRIRKIILQFRENYCKNLFSSVKEAMLPTHIVLVIFAKRPQE